MTFANHEAYFATCTVEAQHLLLQIQQQVEAHIPDAQRCIGYNMPAFKRERIFFYFAAFKKHIGIYPPLNDDAALVAQTARYRGPKGNLSFPYSEPLPLDLIAQVAVALARQYDVPRTKKGSSTNS